MWKLLWFVATLYFGKDNLEGTDRLKPEWFKGNAWGPEATRLRESGQIPPLPMTPAMTQWQTWGKQVLRDGDIVFRLGDAKILRGHFPMSRFIAKVSGSIFSHTGIVAIEGGEAVVYDTTSLSVRRQPFHVWVLDNIGPLGVKRPRPEYAAYVPRALAFCRAQFAKQPPFDYRLGLDDSEYYCVEMSEKAYRSNGLPLAPPVKLRDMENMDQFPICVIGFLKFTDLTLSDQVYFPGNERHGIWSSPYLMTVYEPPGGATAKLPWKWGEPWHTFLAAAIDATDQAKSPRSPTNPTASATAPASQPRPASASAGASQRR